MPQNQVLPKPLFRRFNELLPEDVTFDYHMHSTYSDGGNSPNDMIARAGDLSLSAIAITDHVNRNCPWYGRFCDEIDALRGQHPLTVYKGFEAKALDLEGTLDASEDTIARADLIIGSVHRYPDGQGGLIPLQDVRSLGQERAADTEFGLAMGLVRNRANRVDVLGHPFGVFSKFFEETPADRLEELMKACAEEGVAFEISTRYCRDLDGLVRMLKRANPPVSIGSDAHSAEDVGRRFEELRQDIGQCR